MKLKSDWLTYLHNLRKREIELIFAHCPEHIFDKGLEIGGGDGFQAMLLTKYISNLICTDYNKDRLKKNRMDSIKYMICDAEKIETYFSKNQFDIVFSSNLLEHLPHPEMALVGIRKIQKNEGITIHIIPNPFWELCHMIMFYPNQLIRIIGIVKTEGMFKLLQKIGIRIFGAKKVKVKKAISESRIGNNPKFRNRGPNIYSSLLLPKPHGAYGSIFKEFFALRKNRWVREFEGTGFEVFKIIKGPLSSGYGFGFNNLRSVLEKIGLSSEYIYFVKKAKKFSPYRKYF